MNKKKTPPPRKSTAALPQPAQPIAPPLPSTPPPTGLQETRTLPSEPAAQRVAAKDAYLDTVGANALRKMNEWTVHDKDMRAAEAYLEGLKELVNVRDPLEQMLVNSAAMTYGRLSYLSMLANQQKDTRNVRTVNEACDRASNTLRRLVLSLADYRRPPKTHVFMPIGQMNAAGQQVVQNGNFKNGTESNEQGCHPTAHASPDIPQALPFVPVGTGIPAPGGPVREAVGAVNRTADAGGQSPVKDERDDARGTVGEVDRQQADHQCAAATGRGTGIRPRRCSND